MDLPPEIWQIIIEFTYDPCNKGWHRNLWKIGLVSSIRFAHLAGLDRFCDDAARLQAVAFI